MKEQEDNQPIDAFFARKLGDASLSPGPDGYERLQARISKADPGARVVIRRNTTIQRYMAIAACLLVVCLFGWFYLQSNSASLKQGEQVAASAVKSPNTVTEQSETQTNKNPTVKKSDSSRTGVGSENHLATVNRPAESEQHPYPSVDTYGQLGQNKNKVIDAAGSEKNILTQSPVREDVAKPTLTTLPELKPTNSVAIDTEQPAGEIVKTNAPVERVLTVTIKEPASLVAAQPITGKERVSVNTNEDNSEKEAKGTLWQQVRRIKEGNVFVRHDDLNNDDKGLLGRAYSGLKQSFEKDKSEK